MNVQRFISANCKARGTAFFYLMLPRLRHPLPHRSQADSAGGARSFSPIHILSGGHKHDHEGQTCAFEYCNVSLSPKTDGENAQLHHDYHSCWLKIHLENLSACKDVILQ